MVWVLFLAHQLPLEMVDLVEVVVILRVPKEQDQEIHLKLLPLKEMTEVLLLVLVLLLAMMVVAEAVEPVEQELVEAVLAL